MVAEPSHLILTVDYEVFGNGQGALGECVIAPTDAILAVAERFGAPVTLFVESLELDAMRRAAARLPAGGSAQLTAAEEQIVRAVRRGHDAQLHVHPQWLGAALDDDGAWALDFRRWRIGDLGPATATEAVALGKRALEAIVAGISGHRSVAFRAGAWCIQPSAAVLRALAEARFAIDTSVAPGLHHPARGDWYDFRAAPADRPCWPVEGDVCRPAAEGLWEVPIATGEVSWWHHVLRKGVHRLLPRHGGLAPGCAGSYAGPNGRWQTLRGKLARLCTAGRAMLDYSTLDAGQLIAVTEQWRRLGLAAQRENGAHDALPTPIVAIAHSKTFTRRSAAALEGFLDWAVAQPGLAFSSFPGWLERAGSAGRRGSRQGEEG